MSYIEDNWQYFLPPEIGKYSNGRMAVEYYVQTPDDEYPECACTATINIPDEHLELDEIIVKSYGENDGLYECMLKAGHIGPATRKVYNGFIEANVCKWLYNATEQKG